jgi:hypothetical protein
MTFEKKCLIEPSDILAVQLECGKCRSAISVPVEKIDPDQIASMALAGCRFCQTPSGFQPSTQEMNALLGFITSLKQIAGHLAGRNLKVRLDIKCVD